MKELQNLLLAVYFVLIVVDSTTANAKILLDRIIAVVDKDVLMESELNNRMEAVQLQLKRQDIILLSDDILKKQIMEQLIVESIQLQIGQRSNIRIDHWTLDEVISKIAQSNEISIEMFKKNLVADGMSYDQAREKIRRELIINRVQQQLVEQIKISEQEIDNFLQSPEGQASMQVEYRLSHILIATPDNPSTEQLRSAYQQANNIFIKLNKGENFAKMAISYSNGQYALKGGDLGWRSINKLPTLFTEQSLKMQHGEVSPPIQSPVGFHIFKLIDSRGNEKYMEEQLYMRHILIQPNEIRSDFESQMLASSLYNRIESGENFNELAKVYSDDIGSILNDDSNLHWVARKSLGAKFQKIIAETDQKILVEPFKNSKGWNILQIFGKRTVDVSDQMRRNKIRERLGNFKFKKQLPVWLNEIRDQAYVEIRL